MIDMQRNKKIFKDVNNGRYDRDQKSEFTFESRNSKSGSGKSRSGRHEPQGGSAVKRSKNKKIKSFIKRNQKPEEKKPVTEFEIAKNLKNGKMSMDYTNNFYNNPFSKMSDDEISRFLNSEPPRDIKSKSFTLPKRAYNAAAVTFDNFDINFGEERNKVKPSPMKGTFDDFFNNSDNDDNLNIEHKEIFDILNGLTSVNDTTQEIDIPGMFMNDTP